MPKIIKDGNVINNDWQVLDESQELIAGNILVPLSSWNQHQSAIAERQSDVGVWLKTTEQPNDIQGDINAIPIIAVQFDAFADGRGFSIGTLLRERLQYKGEVRAIGKVIRDQLSYLARCGFNAFDLDEHYDEKAALASLKDFSENYQAALDQPQPLFRRRG